MKYIDNIIEIEVPDNFSLSEKEMDYIMNNLDLLREEDYDKLFYGFRQSKFEGDYSNVTHLTQFLFKWNVNPIPHMSGNLPSFYKTKIIKIIIPNTFNKITSFVGCSNLRVISIPGTIQDISSNEFKNCTNLQQVKLNDGIKCIYDMAFKNCSNLKSITIPKSIIYIGYDAFAECSNLEHLKISKDSLSTLYDDDDKLNASIDFQLNKIGIDTTKTKIEWY